MGRIWSGTLSEAYANMHWFGAKHRVLGAKHRVHRSDFVSQARKLVRHGRTDLAGIGRPLIGVHQDTRIRQQGKHPTICGFPAQLARLLTEGTGSLNRDLRQGQALVEGGRPRIDRATIGVATGRP